MQRLESSPLNAFTMIRQKFVTWASGSEAHKANTFVVQPAAERDSPLSLSAAIAWPHSKHVCHLLV